jgi:hypothetical protein
MTLDQARRFALSLPEAVGAPHFESWSFRVRGKIFATVPPDGKHLHVFVDDATTHASSAAHPKAIEPLYWGKKLAGVRVTLAAAKTAPVYDLLTMAWRRRAPKRLASSGV